MGTQNRIRWGGLISILAAVVGNVFIELGRTNFLIAQTALGLLFFALMLFAIWALRARQAPPGGRLGDLGFVLVIVGAVIEVLYFGLSIALSSGIDNARPVLGFFFNTLPLFYLGAPIFDVGLALFGVATARAGVLPRWAGVLLAAGAILLLAADIDIVGWLGLGILVDPAYVLMGLALAWLGWALWSGVDRQTVS